jgi:hypothetical protein
MTSHIPEEQRKTARSTQLDERLIDICTLQWDHSIVMRSKHVVYWCYECVVYFEWFSSTGN